MLRNILTLFARQISRHFFPLLTTALFISVLFVAPLSASAQLSGPTTCAEARSKPGVVFCQDFDSSPAGDWDLSDLKRDFPGTTGFIAGPTGASGGTGGGRGTIVSGGGAAMSGNSLKTTLLKNTLGSSNGVLFHPPIGASLDEAYFGYWVRFDPSFPNVTGGKLPGLTGGITDAGDIPCCGRPMKQGKGFSTRLMHVNGRGFVNYFYWIDNPTPTSSNGSKYGGPRGRIEVYVPGQWYFIEEHVKLNTPGASNGLFEVWINGKKVTTIANTRIRASGQNFFITNLIFHTYLGGNTSNWWSPIDTYQNFDIVVVSKNRIGGPSGPHVTLTISPQCFNN